MRKSPLRRGKPLGKGKAPLKRRRRLGRGSRMRSAKSRARREARKRARWQKQFHSEEFLAWVHAQPCIRCGRKPSEPHHEPQRSDPRVTWKDVSPLCRDCHTAGPGARHHVGVGAKTFWASLGLDPAETNAETQRLWAEYVPCTKLLRGDTTVPIVVSHRREMTMNETTGWGSKNAEAMFNVATRLAGFDAKELMLEITRRQRDRSCKVYEPTVLEAMQAIANRDPAYVAHREEMKRKYS